MKRIKVIVPVATSLWNESIREVYEANKDHDTAIDIDNLERGPEAIEQHYDDIWAELNTLKKAEMAEEEGYDGVIIYCFGDPAVRPAKEKLHIPVVGIMEASVHFASLLGRRFSIISTIEEGRFASEDLLRIYGFEHKCASIRALGVKVLDLVDKARLEEVVLKTCKAAVDVDGADVLVFGCGSILGFKDKVSETMGVPVVEPGIAALKVCEDLVHIRLSHSKKAYPTPVRIRRTS